ncbi:MAG: carboxylating nicotinate-nucleotide diphosphorylase [Eubacterium sp.]|nr:carboxylating nicotinate-nucleotide diphosphorylase [Eubacterium sp.]
MKINVDEYILNTLREDITSEDVSTNAVMPEDRQGKAELICKQDGVICGLGIFERTFKLLDETSRFETEVKDGDFVKKGQLIGVIYGDIKAILSGERTGLNYLQRMSGIATMTREYMDELKGYKTVLLDTRKTTPNMRPFEKYAVTVGGATNHRYNLSDGVLLKDNHIGAAGSITKAIQMAKAYAPFVRKIEIETETLEQVQEALDAGADIIMLDNMDNETMKKAVEMIGGKAQTECSGNVTKARLKEIAEIGVDFVSCGALTHSAPIMDVSLKNLTPIE